MIFVGPSETLRYPGKSFDKLALKSFTKEGNSRRVCLESPLAGVPTYGKVLLSKVRRQASFDFDEIRRAGYSGFGIRLPAVGIVEREVEIMFR